jgi:transposase
MKNSKYSKEFKDSTIQLVMNSNKSAYQIAQDLDINDKTLYSWLREYKRVHNIQTDDRRTTQKASSKETLEEENKRLRKELAIVKQEREILKKAAAYFAKETL